MLQRFFPLWQEDEVWCWHDGIKAEKRTWLLPAVTMEIWGKRTYEPLMSVRGRVDESVCFWYSCNRYNRLMHVIRLFFQSKSRRWAVMIRWTLILISALWPLTHRLMCEHVWLKLSCFRFFLAVLVFEGLIFESVTSQLCSPEFNLDFYIVLVLDLALVSCLLSLLTADWLFHFECLFSCVSFPSFLSPVLFTLTCVLFSSCLSSHISPGV